MGLPGQSPQESTYRSSALLWPQAITTTLYHWLIKEKPGQCSVRHISPRQAKHPLCSLKHSFMSSSGEWGCHNGLQKGQAQVLRARVTSWQRWLPISSTSPFRASTTIPIAKKQVVCLNDYCPVALTSVITKPADSQTTHPVYLPYTLVQLAYRRNRATDVAIALATHTLPCPPGKREHICVKALSWLQLSIQHDSESWKTHFLLAHHKHGTVQMIWPSRATMTVYRVDMKGPNNWC